MNINKKNRMASEQQLKAGTQAHLKGGLHLDGASLDYKDGLQGAGFAISNPNAERTCGCGQSFS